MINVTPAAATVLISVVLLATAWADDRPTTTTAPAPAADGALREALDAEPAPPWEWVRKDASGVRVKDGALELKALPGTLWGKGGSAKNQLLRPSPLPAGDPVA